jgi:hypothetical protein
MKEYLVIRTHEGSLQTDLNSHAPNGWRVISVKWSTESAGGIFWPEVILIWEREVQEA